MKTPRAIAPATTQQCIDLINSGNFVDWDLYTFTLFGGGVLRYTTANFDITDGVNTWSSTGPRVDNAGSKVTGHWKIGLDTDTWVVVLAPRPFDAITRATFPDKIGSIPWLQAAQGGVLDSADVQVDRAYFAAPPAFPMAALSAKPSGLITVFAGTVGPVDVGSTSTVLTLYDYRRVLANPLPAHVYQGQCRHRLFDEACNNAGSNAAAGFVKTASVGAGSTNAIIIAHALAAPAGSGTYALGTLVMTSGANNGFRRTIAASDGVNLQLVDPLPFDLIAGDTFQAYPGCDKRFTTCGLFGHAANGNQDNFGGQPYIPDAATAI